MPRFSPDQLTDKALAAVAEAGRAALEGPIERTEALRFVLAFLANGCDDREPFDHFWKEIAEPVTDNLATNFGRRQTINNLVGYIHRLAGREPPG